MALERRFNGPVIITSTQGGSNIEEIAAENPDAIIRHPINIEHGLQREDALGIADQLGFRNEAMEEVCSTNCGGKQITKGPSLGGRDDVEIVSSIQRQRRCFVGNKSTD